MPLNVTPNEQLAELVLQRLPLPRAKTIIRRRHYMRTWPQGATLALGAVYGGRVVSCDVYGYCSSTEAKVAKLGVKLHRNQMIEKQRFWIHDQIGHNAESFLMAKAHKYLKKNGVMLVLTHAGGCKNDCGIIFQAAGWQYFGSTPCDDFYLTETGEYRNLIAEMRFGRVKSAGKTRQQIGEEVFGPGEIVQASRYTYAFATNKALRRKLARIALPYPKDSERFRFKQEWCTTEGC